MSQAPEVGGAMQGSPRIVLCGGALYTTNLGFGVPLENQNMAIVTICDFVMVWITND